MSGPAASIRIFESEIDQIVDTVSGSPTLETGGELLGLWSHADMPTVMLAGVTVMLAGTPAPESQRGSTWFEQDPEAHMELERLTWQDYGVQVVGLWHSHHQLSLHELSGGDLRRTRGYSLRHGRPRYSEILAFFTEFESHSSHGRSRGRATVGLRPYVYENAASGEALRSRIELLPGESPLRAALRRVKLGRSLAQVVGGAGRRRDSRVAYQLLEHRPNDRAGAYASTRGEPQLAPEDVSEARVQEADHEGDVAVEEPLEVPATAGPEAEIVPAEEPVDVTEAADARAGRGPVDEAREPPPRHVPPPATSVPVRVSTPAAPPESRWPLSALEQAVEVAVPDDLACRVRISPRPHGLQLEVPSPDGKAYFIVAIAGDSPGAGRVSTALAEDHRRPHVFIKDRKASKVDLPAVLAEGLVKLGYRRTR